MSGECNKDDESIIILKNLITSVMKDSNYFDEDHQYERMNDLDKVACVLRQLIPIVRNIVSENKRCDGCVDNGDLNNDPTKYVIPRRYCDALVDMIYYTKNMKPFGDICEG